MGRCVLLDRQFDKAALILMLITGKPVIYNRKRGRWETIQEPAQDAGQREEERENGR